MKLFWVPSNQTRLSIQESSWKYKRNSTQGSSIFIHRLKDNISHGGQLVSSLVRIALHQFYIHPSLLHLQPLWPSIKHPALYDHCLYLIDRNHACMPWREGIKDERPIQKATHICIGSFFRVRCNINVRLVHTIIVERATLGEILLVKQLNGAQCIDCLLSIQTMTAETTYVWQHPWLFMSPCHSKAENSFTAFSWQLAAVTRDEQWCLPLPWETSTAAINLGGQ